MADFVLDASATLPWGFEDETTEWSEALLDRVVRWQGAIVPAHWPSEVANALLMARRRGRITVDQVRDFCKDLTDLRVRVDSAVEPAEWPALIALAERYGLTIYDAAYLDLSRRFELPLATLDKRLVRAAAAEGVPLV